MVRVGADKPFNSTWDTWDDTCSLNSGDVVSWEASQPCRTAKVCGRPLVRTLVIEAVSADVLGPASGETSSAIVPV